VVDFVLCCRAAVDARTGETSSKLIFHYYCFHNPVCPAWPMITQCSAEKVCTTPIFLFLSSERESTMSLLAANTKVRSTNRAKGFTPPELTNISVDLYFHLQLHLESYTAT
jgi:hypothetical protein